MDRESVIISRYEEVEVYIPVNQPVGQVSFPPNISTLTNNPDRKVFIKNMECFPDYCQTNSVRKTSMPVMPVTEIPKISFALYYNSEVAIRYVPLVRSIYAVPPANVNSPYSREITPYDMLYPVAMEQCFLQFNAVGAGTAYAVVFGFTYVWVPVVK